MEGALGHGQGISSRLTPHGRKPAEMKETSESEWFLRMAA